MSQAHTSSQLQAHASSQLQAQNSTQLQPAPNSQSSVAESTHLILSLNSFRSTNAVDGVTRTQQPIFQLKPAGITAWRLCDLTRLTEALQAKQVAHYAQNVGQTVVLYFRLEVYSACTQTSQELGLRITHAVPERLCTALQAWAQSWKLDTASECVQAALGEALWQRLKPFQQTAVQTIVGKGSLLLADEMGCGKTIEALACLGVWLHLYPSGVAVIVCPSVLRENWRCEALKWLKDHVLEHEVFVVSKQKDALECLARRHRIYIVSYTMLSATLKGPKANAKIVDLLCGLKPEVLVLDESQKIKHSSTSQTSSSLSLARSARHRLLLSGTPCNRPAELWPQIYAVVPTLFPHFHRSPPTQVALSQRVVGMADDFAVLFCQPQLKHIRGMPKPIWEYRGASNETLLSTVLATLQLRRTKQEVLPQLPPKVHRTVYLAPPNASQRKKIQGLLSQDTFTGQTTASGVPLHQRSKFIEAYGLTSSYKQEGVVQWLEETFLPQLTIGGEQALIFVHHQPMRLQITSLLERLKLTHFAIYEGVPDKKRQIYQQWFREGRYQIAVLSIMAAGTGLTLTTASQVVFADLRFGPDDMKQAEDRAHRIGQTQTVYVTYLMLPNSTDDVCYGMIHKKEKLSATMLCDEPPVPRVRSSAHGIPKPPNPNDLSDHEPNNYAKPSDPSTRANNDSLAHLSNELPDQDCDESLESEVEEPAIKKRKIMG